MSEKSFKHTNALINTNSPYLQQHAHNPVNWYPWGDEALNKAKEEDKPILLSIGYSSCHWCHVMAHESFEDDSVAGIMNENFINIKLDREERPDIDQIYMDAVQAMGLRGGWPLNVFLFPDQKPFYGGTYFPKENWKQLLQAISKAYQNNRSQLYESALNFTKTLNEEMSQININGSGKLPDKGSIKKSYGTLSARFDAEWGGIKKAPKFPMPSVWQFVLQYYYQSNDQSALDHLTLTLDKISDGGIYDHIGGGFARYAVDNEWHVPHFEKMLYDNGQLMALYADVYKVTKNETYKKVLLETGKWLEREMMDENGGFYAALDADSEGEEGKYYVWYYDEFTEVAGQHKEILSAYFDVKPGGNWESKNVLRKLQTDGSIAKQFKISLPELNEIIVDFKKKALEIREKRIKPGLDNKIIAGWNGHALTGLLSAYQATSDPLFESLAKQNAQFIQQSLIKDHQLIRTHGSNISGFLEDYAAVIEAFILYYETFYDEKYLETARDLTQIVLSDFFDQNDHLFFYTSDSSETLITRKKEVFDNVIPSSNSIMANNLFHLGSIYDETSYKEISNQMMIKMADTTISEPEYLSNWGNLLLTMNGQQAEVIILGSESNSFGHQITKNYIPDMVIMAATEDSDLPLFEHKYPLNDATTVYVCYNKTCKRPVNSPNEALEQLLEKAIFFD